MNVYKKIIGSILCMCIICTGCILNVFAQNIGADNMLIEGQYFDEKDPRGIGTFTEEEKRNGLEKAMLSRKVVSIMNDINKGNKIVDNADIEIIQEYINKYNPNSTMTDFISYNNGGISNRAVGDYQTRNLNLPGIMQEENNYCAPASIQAVLKGKGINVSQSVLASYCGIVAGGSGTYLHMVAPTLNRYNSSNGGSNLNFYYDTLLPSEVPASSWNVTMTDSAIATIVGGYGVIYDVHQIKGSSHYLQGYQTMVADEILHYVAGEGFDATDPSRRICYYFDSNNQKTNLGNRHMQITFASMGVLTNDMGLVF